MPDVVDIPKVSIAMDEAISHPTQPLGPENPKLRKASSDMVAESWRKSPLHEGFLKPFDPFCCEQQLTLEWPKWSKSRMTRGLVRR